MNLVVLMRRVDHIEHIVQVSQSISGKKKNIYFDSGSIG